MVIRLLGLGRIRNKTWKLYGFGYFFISGLKSSNEVKNSYRVFFFEKFKPTSEYIWNSTKKNFVLTYINYNINDSDFWSRSIVWLKGARIAGLYNFKQLVMLNRVIQMLKYLI